MSIMLEHNTNMTVIDEERTSAVKALPSQLHTLTPADQYLMSLRSSNSRRTMKSALNSIAVMLGAKNYKQVGFSNMKSSDVSLVLEMMRTTKDMNPTTINLYLSAMKGVFKYCWKSHEMGYEDYMMLKSIEGVNGKRLKRDKVVLAGQDIAAMNRACIEEGTIAGIRDSAIISILAGCGLRREELATLKMKDLDEPSSRLFIKGKGNKERVSIMPEVAKEKLLDWLCERGQDEGEIFVRITRHDTVYKHKQGLSGQAVYDVLAKRAKVIGIDKIHPHAMRHYFATTHIRNGVDIVTVRDMMGHESVVTTQKYIDKDESAIMKAVNDITL